VLDFVGAATNRRLEGEDAAQHTGSTTVAAWEGDKSESETPRRCRRCGVALSAGERVWWDRRDPDRHRFCSESCLRALQAAWRQSEVEMEVRVAAYRLQGKKWERNARLHRELFTPWWKPPLSAAEVSAKDEAIKRELRITPDMEYRPRPVPRASRDE
jgi:hypothetical protein